MIAATAGAGIAATAGARIAATAGARITAAAGAGITAAAGARIAAAAGARITAAAGAGITATAGAGITAANRSTRVGVTARTGGGPIRFAIRCCRGDCVCRRQSLTLCSSGSIDLVCVSNRATLTRENGALGDFPLRRDGYE